MAGLNLALLSIFPALKVAPLAVTPLLMMDNFAYLYIGLILVSTLACVTLAHAYLGEGGTGYPGNREELYLLILLSATVRPSPSTTTCSALKAERWWARITTASTSTCTATRRIKT